MRLFSKRYKLDLKNSPGKLNHLFTFYSSTISIVILIKFIIF